MPYSLLKKYGLFLCLFTCSSIFSLAYGRPVFLGYDPVSIMANSHSPTSILWLSIYAGILLTLLIYALFLFLTLRSISYLYHALLTASLLLAFGSFNGLWFVLFGTELVKWQTPLQSLSLILASLCAIAFCRSLLFLSSFSPKLDTFLSRFSLIFALTLIASFFAPMDYIAYGVTALIIILSISVLLACIQPCLKGNRSAQLLFCAWFILLGGISLSLLQHFSWLEPSWLTRYALSISALLFVFLHAFALSYQLIITQSQTRKLHQKLLAESKKKVADQVKEQTKELTELNQRLRQQEDVLKKLAFYDRLTGLANQVFIQEQLKQLLAQSRRNKSKLSVLFLDLDNFKPINDEYGHNVGDEVLVIIAKRLQTSLRESDVVGRLGCDKFLVLLESSRGDSHDPNEVADKIKVTIAQPISMDWFILNIDTSIGIAHYPNDGKDATSLITAAESAMQAIKIEKKKARSQ